MRVYKVKWKAKRREWKVYTVWFDNNKAEMRSIYDEYLLKKVDV